MSVSREFLLNLGNRSSVSTKEAKERLRSRSHLHFSPLLLTFPFLLPPPPFFYAFRSFVFTTDEILGQIASRSREDEKGARLRIRRVSIILQKTLALFAERTGTRFFHPLPTESLLNASSNNCRKLVVGYRGMVNSSSFPVE